MEQWRSKYINLQPTPAEVYNTLAMPVILSASGYFGAEPLTIHDKKDVFHAMIYTKTPSFSAIIADGSPATANYQIVDGVMIVTIR